MAESKTKPQWWWWKNVILSLVGTGGIGAIAIAVLSHSGRPSNSDIQNNYSGTVSGPTFNTIGNSNTINNSTTIINPAGTKRAEPAAPTPNGAYFPGTHITHANLQEVFPFGYVVFSERDGRWTYEPLAAGNLHYSCDWASVSIIPDWSRKTVLWKIPNFNASKEGASFAVRSMDLATGPIPMTKATIYSVDTPGLFGDPRTFVITLSDNQRFPVFALGFRIQPRGSANQK